MLEMVVVMAIAGSLMAIAVSGWQGWSKASAQDGLVSQLQLTLRQAQQRAVTTGTSTCVAFDEDDDSWQIFDVACANTDGVTPSATDRADGGLDLQDVDFGGADAVTFSPRGTGEEGTVVIAREGGDRQVTIHVERLTGRVSTR
jgi:type II secretory pathway pseudopilin PulG